MIQQSWSNLDCTGYRSSILTSTRTTMRCAIPRDVSSSRVDRSKRDDWAWSRSMDHGILDTVNVHAIVLNRDNLLEKGLFSVESRKFLRCLWRNQSVFGDQIFKLVVQCVALRVGFRGYIKGAVWQFVDFWKNEYARKNMDCKVSHIDQDIFFSIFLQESLFLFVSSGWTLLLKHKMEWIRYIWSITDIILCICIIVIHIIITSTIYLSMLLIFLIIYF